jgi:nucleosome assembly protein 1-like 1
VVPENPDDLSEEELEALQQQMDEDYEIATALRDSLVPRAVEWFTGEAAPPLYDDEFEGGEFDEDEFEGGEPEDEEPRRRR